MQRDFELVCTAPSIGEADIIVAWLERGGVRAHVKDRHMAGTLTWGTPAIAPRGIEIVAAPEDSERASTLWAERLRSDTTKLQQPGEAETVDAECEECGAKSSFPSASRGRVENCPACGDYMDVPSE